MPPRPVRSLSLPSTLNPQPSTHLLLALVVTLLVACGRSATPAPPAAGGTAIPPSGSQAASTGGQGASPPARSVAQPSTHNPQPVTADAGAAATATAAARRDQPIKLTLGDRSWTTTLGELGLVGTAPGPSGPPELEAFLARIGPELEQPARDARLRIRGDGAIELTSAARGLALDAATSRERVIAAASGGRPSAELVARAVDPTLTDAQTAAAAAQLRKILGREDGPILTVKGGERSWTLDRAEAAELLALDLPKAAGEPIKVTLDEWATKAFVGRLAKALDREPVEARFRLSSGKPKLLREARPGRALDQEGALDAFRKTLLTAERALDLPLKPVEPVVGNDPSALGPLELIESGSTALGGAIPEKRANIKLAAERLNGTVVAPGATFSFNREVGPTTLEAGFKWGFGITSGSEGVKTVPSVAGGICQVATTLFQPVFWAGYPLEERYWHLYWIPAYASRGIVGLDVT
ncbi:MAG TPA: VanW family protein, partial [Chloroflexota bacterium]